MNISADEVKNRVSFDHSHEPKAVAVIAVLAVIISLYASWIMADLVPRLVIFIVAFIFGGYLLYSRVEIRNIVSTFLYILAGLFLITPVMLILPDLANSDMVPGASRLFMDEITAIIFVVFIVIAGVTMGIGYYVSRNTE